MHNFLELAKGVESAASCSDFGPQGRRSKGGCTCRTVLT